MKTKMVDGNGYCFVCGNNGLLDKVCPSCGREPKKLSINLEENADAFVEKIDAFGVPGPYRGVFWNADVLRKSFREKSNDKLFEHYVSQLDKINNVFVSGVVSSKSAIIIAPAGYSKMTFAFSCMQRALDAGLSVAPFLDTSELKRLLMLSSDNPTYRLYNKITYDDYVMADVCFITVSKLPSHEWAFNVIQEILDRRSRRGLSTFIISRYDLNEISRRDSSNQFGVLTTAMATDTFKYPAIIRYKAF